MRVYTRCRYVYAFCIAHDHSCSSQPPKKVVASFYSRPFVSFCASFPQSLHKLLITLWPYRRGGGVGTHSLVVYVITYLMEPPRSGWCLMT